MTKKTKYLHKLANAIRAVQGSQYHPPQKKSKSRLHRWLFRCEYAGYIKPNLWKTPTTKPQ